MPVAAAASAQADSASVQPARGALVIERIEVTGNTRTRPEVILRAIPIAVGDEAEPSRILAAADALDRSTLVKSAKVHTRPGTAPGRVVVVIAVEEGAPHVRFGAGYENLSGWYLIPIEFNLDNLTGHGEGLSLGYRLGYRLNSLDLNFRSQVTRDNRPWWELGGHLQNLARIYYYEGTELNHKVQRGRVRAGLGVPLGDEFTLETRLVFEAVHADSDAVVYQDREILGREEGDVVPYPLLPPEIQEGVGTRQQARLALSLTRDRRRGANLTQHGGWSRLQVEGVASSESPFLGVGLDVRQYAALRGVQLAGRFRLDGVTEGAPFYERPYLGGLYTVRGFPSQSLSPTGGDLLVATGSVEVRTRWIGSREKPLLTGLAFLDVGVGWAEAPYDKGSVAAGIGYGWRVGIPWIQQLGVDVGFPLTDSPVNESFHVNISLWWTF